MQFWALCAAVAACQSPQQVIGNKEDMMAAAGFKFVPANTPARQASFKNLPPHKFSREIKNGQVFYVYPDPTVCVCLYVGNQAAYGQVPEERVREEHGRRAADDRQLNADMNELGLGSVGRLPVSGLVLLAPDRVRAARTIWRPRAGAPSN